MIGLRLWSKRKREITPEFGPVLLNDYDQTRQAIANLRLADKQGKYAGRTACQSCIFDPTAEYVIRG